MILYKLFFLNLFVVLFVLPSLQAENQNIATVIKVIDGDTLKIKYQSSEENIRLIGIDTPESKINKKAKKDSKRSGQDIKTIIALGDKAANFTRSLVKPGNTIKVEFDVQQRDRYGRILGYIYLNNGKMLNEEIIKAGYANIMTVPPNVKHQEVFLIAYREASNNRKGLWKGVENEYEKSSQRRYSCRRTRHQIFARDQSHAQRNAAGA